VGQLSLQLLSLYAVSRYSIEIFRGDSIRGLWFDGSISTSQLISCVVFVTCIGLLLRNRGRTDTGAQPPPATEASGMA
jgi:prolipoprotein diacylglyceryltransferase